MATQLQATPTLYGKDAKEIFNEINRVPSKEQQAILLAKLTEEELGDLANFDCNDEEMNKQLLRLGRENY